MSIYDSLITESKDDGNKSISGITTGIVKENYDDKHPGMVKVEIFMGEEKKNVTDWVRVMQPYAGNGYGSYMLPEVGDEVVISFNLGDANRPYVLGSLWNNGNNKPPEKTATAKNTVKRLKTKGGHEIIFEEEKDKGRIEIHTPKNLKITLEDENQTITITDEKGKNMLIIEGKKGEISVKAKKVINFDAGGKAVLKLNANDNSATLKAGKINIEGSQSLNLKSQNIKAAGTMVELKGNGNVKVEATGILTLKGSMAKIN